MILDQDDVMEMVATGNGHLLRKVLLNEQQLKLLKRIANTEYMTSAELVKKDGISIQLANGRLRALYDKGYLVRSNEGSLTGGDEYYYWATDQMVNLLNKG